MASDHELIGTMRSVNSFQVVSCIDINKFFFKREQEGFYC